MRFTSDKPHDEVVQLIQQVIAPDARWEPVGRDWYAFRRDGSEPTSAQQEQLRALLYDMPAGWSLVGTTDTDIDNWIAGVTDIATARQRIAVMAKLLVYLMRRSLK